MEEKSLNLVQKLAKVRASADVVKKGKQGYGYKYSDIVDILANVTGAMKKNRVSLIPKIVPGTLQVSQNVINNTKIDKAGTPYQNTSTEMLIKADMIFTWVDEDNPTDFIDVPWCIVGAQADPSQAFGSGLTYCTRYFLTSYFQIAQTSTDVDAYRSQQKEAEEREDREIAAGIISQFDSKVREYLQKNTDKQNDVKRFVSGYVKNGNYMSIKDSETAANLLTEFNEKFMEVDK